MGYLMFATLMGHLWGDYLLQSKYMALNKTKDIKVCLLHCAIYSLAVSLAIWKFSPLLFLAIFLTHFPIDYWSLGDKWLKLIKGRELMKEYELEGEYRELRLPFAALVYAVVDNTLHLTLLWFVMMLFFE